MLLDFTIQNFLSFQKEASLSMLAAKTVKEIESSEGEYINTWILPEVDARVLRTSAIYGANGSGKSNFIQAMSYFRELVLFSVMNESLMRNSQKLHYSLSPNGETMPIAMQIIFVDNGVKYRYGFEIQDGKVLSEWLFTQKFSESTKESYCFKREKNTIKVNAKTYKGAKGINAKTRINALFISTCAQFNVQTAMVIKEWFRKKFNVISGLDNTLRYTANCYMHNEEMHNKILDFVKLIDLGIEDINITEEIINEENNINPIERLTFQLAQNINPKIDKLNHLDIRATHAVYNEGNVVGHTEIPFQMESLGTNKLFALLGPWFDTLKNGGVLVVDEYGASLHTQLSLKLINLFHSKMNLYGAQLIISTHDTNLLRKDLLRRDQIWFVEKDKLGASDLYSLVEYKVNQATSVRNDASFEKDYLLGKYGAIPYFGNIEKFINDYGKEE